MRIVKLEQTCSACPSQWEGKTADNRFIYIRYRWGYLSIRVSEPDADDIINAVRGQEIFGANVGDSFDGAIEIDEVMELSKGIIEFFPKIA